jgi:predicted enzyme related to lactoylglutathione lyase
MGFEVEAVFLAVDDPAEALRFYGEVLGLEVRCADLDDGYRIGLVATGGRDPAIRLEPSEAPAGGDAGIVLRTDDVDMVFENLVTAGVEVVSEPVGSGPGRRRCAFLDPSGNLVRLEEVAVVRGGPPPPRPPAERRIDTERRLDADVDVWVASASEDGVPHLVPLSFDWEDGHLLIATPASTPTGRNLADGGVVRLALGHLRDVVMVEGRAEAFDLDALPRDRVERFVRRTDFDPRTSPGDYRWFRITPLRVQAWREVNEIKGRDLMREGRWLV